MTPESLTGCLYTLTLALMHVHAHRYADAATEIENAMGFVGLTAEREPQRIDHRRLIGWLLRAQSDANSFIEAFEDGATVEVLWPQSINQFAAAMSAARKVALALAGQEAGAA